MSSSSLVPPMKSLSSSFSIIPYYIYAVNTNLCSTNLCRISRRRNRKHVSSAPVQDFFPSKPAWVQIRFLNILHGCSFFLLPVHFFCRKLRKAQPLRRAWCAPSLFSFPPLPMKRSHNAVSVAQTREEYMRYWLY